MLQTRTSRWAALTACACLAVLVAAWFLLVSPRRGEAADIQDQVAAAATQNDALELKISQLRAQFATLAQDRTELAKIYTQLPKDAQTADLVRSLDAMAAASGVVLKSVTPGAASYLTAASGTAGSSTGASGAAGSAGPSNAASGAASGAVSAAAARVVAIPIVVAVHGDYFPTVLFLKKLQSELPRAFLVSGLQVQGQPGGGTGVGVVDLTITGKVFALPDPGSSTAGSGSGSAGSGSAGSGSAGSATTSGGSVVTTTSRGGQAGGETPDTRAVSALAGVSRAGAATHRLSED